MQQDLWSLFDVRANVNQNWHKIVNIQDQFVFLHRCIIKSIGLLLHTLPLKISVAEGKNKVCKD